MEPVFTPIANSESPNKAAASDFTGMFSSKERFAAWSRLVLRDLNKNPSSPTFYRYTREDIQNYLANPYSNQKNLRDAVTYIYSASSHFRRLIQYFVGLSDCAYVVSPYRIDPRSANTKTVGRNYRKVLNVMSSMNIRQQLRDILTVCLMHDTCYLTMWVTADSITFQHLPADHCSISIIEGNVPNVTFDFRYFDTNPAQLDYYPPEFKTKYGKYQKDPANLRYQDLDSPTSFAVKCNSEIMGYSVPPFVAILREVYDIEDYKQLRMVRTALENYAMLVMRLGINDDGDWEMDLGKAKEFWRNLENVLPDEVGSVLSPMDIQKISFERTNTSNTDTVADAEENLFSAAGVSSLLFNNDKATANAILLSIKADQAITYKIVLAFEQAINRYIQSQSFGKNFKVTFLDCSPFNRKEVGDGYLKACQYGIPMVSYYCASQGLSQSEMDCMNFLENDVIGVKDLFIPLQSSSTRSAADADSKAPTDEGGAPVKDAEDLSESGDRLQGEA